MRITNVPCPQPKSNNLPSPCHASPNPACSGDRTSDTNAATARLYEDGRFPTPDRRARFIAVEHDEPLEPVDERFPLVLTTGRVRDHWHTLTRTGKSRALMQRTPEPVLEVSTRDAVRLGLHDGDFVEVTSRRGTAVAQCRVSDAIRAVNAQLIAIASARGIAVVDSDALTQTLLQRVDKTGLFHIGREQIDVFARGNEPHHGRLDDTAGHAGTVISGVIANEIFIRSFDEQFGAGIPLLSDEEILQSAGLLASQ